jgi:hypothetical protein
MHNINSFSELLVQGQITEALQLRLSSIEASARHYRQDLEAAKVSSAALGVVGLLLSANPLVAVIAGCGLAGYGWTVLRDYQNTKRLCLLPLVRKGTGELLTGIGLAAANEQGEADDPLIGVIGYVEPELAHEYELVMVAEAQLIGYLAQLPGESRLNAFRHILRHTRLRNSLKLPPLQDVALAIGEAGRSVTRSDSDVGASASIANGSVPSSSQSLPPQPGPVAKEVPTIEVEATPVEEKPTQIEVTASSVPNPPTVTPTSSKLEPVDIALKMAEVPKSTIIAASPRVGKGVVVSMAIAYLRQLHPNLEIWLIDPKDEPTERHYWSLIDPDKRCHFDLRDFDVDVETAIEVFSEHITRFNRSEAHRKLLIIDEFVTLNQKCAGQFMNQLKDFVVGICSSGEVNPDMGIGRFVWAITQSPYVSDLGFKTKAALATFQRIFLLNKASVHLYSLAVSASFVPAGFDQKLNRLLEPTGRVFYYSRTDSWHPIPSYQLSNQSSDSSLREKLEGLLPRTSQLPENHPEAAGNAGSSSQNSEAPEAPREEALPDNEEWRKYFPSAPEAVEEALFGAYQKALEVEGGKKKFICEILKAGTGGRKYQAASAYVDYLCKKFGNKQ